MKIVFATDFYYPSVGGVEIETQRMASELINAGHDVWILAPFSNLFGKYQTEGRIHIIRIKAPLKYFTPSLFVKNKIFKELKKINPDVIHIQTSMTISKTASLYAKNNKIACVATGHYAKGEVEYKFRNFNFVSNLIDLVVRSSYKNTWKNINIATVPSNFSYDYFKSLIVPGTEIVTISNGIKQRPSLEKNINKSKIKTILYVGRFVPSKNVESILKILPNIISKVKTRLVLVGGGIEEKKLKSLAQELNVSDNVIFTGYANEDKVGGYYENSDVFVTASTADNQPLTILESLASGLPVVAARAGGIPELVSHGKNGYLFETNDFDSLTKYILKILLDDKLRNKMSKSAVSASKRHDIQDVSVNMLNLYQKAIAINEMKQKSAPAAPFYLTRGFATRMAFALFLLGVLFRNLLISPTLAKAKTIELKNKILNSKIVTKIENIDLNLKTTLPKAIINK